MKWRKGKLPPLPKTKVLLHHAFAAPDGKRVWLVGANNNWPLMLRSDDGGASWADLSSSVKNVTKQVELHSGFALDAKNIWIGGEKGTLLYHGNGGSLPVPK